MVEFVYNDSVNKTTGLNPFEVIIGFKPKQQIDLILMAHHHFRVSDSASAFTSHIHALHKKIRKKIMKNNVNYKASADLHRKLKTFNVRDYVMVCLRPEQFPTGTVKKLHAQSADHPHPQENQFKCLCDGSSTKL